MKETFLKQEYSRLQALLGPTSNFFLALTAWFTSVVAVEGLFVHFRDTITMDDAEDLQIIVDNKWESDMSVKTETINNSIGDINGAHLEFMDFVDKVTDRLFESTSDHIAVSDEDIHQWAVDMKRMILEDHTTMADIHEMAMQRGAAFISRVVRGLCVFFPLTLRNKCECVW